MAIAVSRRELVEVALQVCPSTSSDDLHGDVLQTILSLLPFSDLVPASFVSHAWLSQVQLALIVHARPHPWLLLHLPGHCYAFDPHSLTWLDLPSPNIPTTVRLLSSTQSMLYHLSPSSLAVSVNAGDWVDLGPPRSWRLDPLVALAGTNQVVVAGGYDPLDNDKDPLSVDLYSIVGVASGDNRRRSCRSLPDAFKGSASRVWLSAAASERYMFVLGKSTGEFSAMDLASGEWSPPARLKPDPCIYYSVIGYTNGRIILLGLIGTDNRPTDIRVWEVLNDHEHDRLWSECRPLGDMPTDLLELLVEETVDGELPAVELCVMGDMLYIYCSSDPRLIVHSRILADRLNKWVISPIPMAGNWPDRPVFACSHVGIDRLRESYRVKNGI